MAVTAYDSLTISLSPGSSVLLFRTKTSKFSEPKAVVSESTLEVLIRRATSNSMVLGLHVPVEEMRLYKGAQYMHHRFICMNV